MDTIKSNDGPEMKEYQRSYIELIARKVGDEIYQRLEEKHYDHEKRLLKIEKKVFNGFSTKINILFAIYSIFIGLLVKLAFF